MSSMSQIKPTQIIPGRENRINPASSLPVDLDPIQRSLVLDPIVTIDNPVVDQSGITSEDFALQSTESVLAQSDPVPATPAILSVKEQIVKFMPDGTAKIDLILEVQDIQGAVEYDIRVAKDAGTV
jgi:hypothetical protein